MPAWKVSDERTASELRSRIGENTSVEIDSRSVALDGSDAVILAPTVHKGVTMLITARRRNSTPANNSSALLDQPGQSISEQNVEPQPLLAGLPDETASFEAPNTVEDQPSESEVVATDADPTFIES